MNIFNCSCVKQIQVCNCCKRYEREKHDNLIFKQIIATEQHVIICWLAKEIKTLVLITQKHNTYMQTHFIKLQGRKLLNP